ncbi:MAG: hypothetical protein SNJ71_00650 [Bacteroidales bacterium]
MLSQMVNYVRVRDIENICAIEKERNSYIDEDFDVLMYKKTFLTKENIIDLLHKDRVVALKVSDGDFILGYIINLYLEKSYKILKFEIAETVDNPVLVFIHLIEKMVRSKNRKYISCIVHETELYKIDILKACDFQFEGYYKNSDEYYLFKYYISQ